MPSLNHAPPAFAAHDVRYVAPRRVVFDSQLGMSFSADFRSYLTNLRLGQLCQIAALTSVVCAVGYLVSLILRPRSPSKVARVDAAIVSFPARMSSLMRCGWRSTMLQFANNGGGDALSSLIMDRCETGSSSGQWPNNAFFNGAFEQAANNCHARSMRRAARCGRSVADEAGVMRCAQIAGHHVLVAIRNRAYSASSHFSLLTGWVGQSALRCFQHPARTHLYRTEGANASS